jgi:hypothetical protein
MKVICIYYIKNFINFYNNFIKLMTYVDLNKVQLFGFKMLKVSLYIFFSHFFFIFSSFLLGIATIPTNSPIPAKIRPFLMVSMNDVYMKSLNNNDNDKDDESANEFNVINVFNSFKSIALSEIEKLKTTEIKQDEIHINKQIIEFINKSLSPDMVSAYVNNYKIEKKLEKIARKYDEEVRARVVTNDQKSKFLDNNLLNNNSSSSSSSSSSTTTNSSSSAVLTFRSIKYAKRAVILLLLLLLLLLIFIF